MTIGLAIVGAGYWGPNLVRTALATPALRLDWLCDLDVERARTVLGAYTMVRPTDSYDAVLSDPDVAAVAIATPAATHFDLIRSALEAGKHVLVEKPLTATVAEAEKLTALARGSGLALMCDHTYCYTPAVQRIRQLLRSGEIGEVQFIDSVRINLGLVQPDVDVLWDLAPHDLSILDFVLPEGIRPVAVAAHVGDPIGAGRACLAYLSLWLSNGALAHVHVNWLSPTKIRTTVFGGSRRTIVWDDTNPTAPAGHPRPGRRHAGSARRAAGSAAPGPHLVPHRGYPHPRAARTGSPAVGDDRIQRGHHRRTPAPHRRGGGAARAQAAGRRIPERGERWLADLANGVGE